MTAARRMVPVVALVLLAGIAVLWRYGDRLATAATLRDRLDQLPLYPGAELDRETVYRTIEDSGPGPWTVSRYYRLPDDATTATIGAFYADHHPPGWTPVGTDQCRDLTSGHVDGSAPTEGAAPHLVPARSQIILLLPGWEPGAWPDWPEMVGIDLYTSNGDRWMRIGRADSIACGYDDFDWKADDFDALAPREGDALSLRFETLPNAICQILAASFGDGEHRTRVQLDPGVDVACRVAPQAVRVEDLEGDGDLDVAMVDRIDPSEDGMVFGRWIQAADGSFARDASCEVRLADGQAPYLAPC